MPVITRTQQLDRPLEEVWDFFSDPGNLQKLMPDDMHFQLRGEPPKKMHEGLILKYWVAPIGGIKLPWTSKITHIEHQKYFVDEQIKGLFHKWRHEHRFEAAEGRTKVTDKVQIEMPLGAAGKLFYPHIVKGIVDRVFNVREKKAAAILNDQEA